MRWLLTPLLWLLAVALALFVLYRLWRRKNVVLRGKWSPRVVRMVAVVLVILGVGTHEADAAPVPPKAKPSAGRDEETRTLTAATIVHWYRWEQSSGPWASFKQAYTRLTASGKENPRALGEAQQLTKQIPGRLRVLIEEELKARAADKALPLPRFTNLDRALSEAETMGMYDHWVTAYLWRASGRLPARERTHLAGFYARLHRHARLTNTLIRAQARVKPFLMPPRAWMSKAGPPRGWRQAQEKGMKDLLAAVGVLYASSDAGTWERDGSVLLRVPEGSAPLTVREAGRSRVIATQATLRIDRLDLVQTGDKAVPLQHAWLGEVTLPARRTVSVWDLPGLLSKDARAKVEKAVAEALKGDEESARELEKALPFAQEVLRERLSATPDAKGAPRMRLILSLFDDAVMPVLANPKIPPGLQRRFGGRRR
jgi:hypothetical protein